MCNAIKITNYIQYTCIPSTSFQYEVLISVVGGIQDVDTLLKNLNLHNVDKVAGKYSGGMKRRLSVAISLIGNTKVRMVTCIQYFRIVRVEAWSFIVL